MQKDSLRIVTFGDKLLPRSFHARIFQFGSFFFSINVAFDQESLWKKGAFELWVAI